MRSEEATNAVVNSANDVLALRRIAARHPASPPSAARNTPAQSAATISADQPTIGQPARTKAVRGWTEEGAVAIAELSSSPRAATQPGTFARPWRRLRRGRPVPRPDPRDLQNCRGPCDGHGLWSGVVPRPMREQWTGLARSMTLPAAAAAALASAYALTERALGVGPEWAVALLATAAGLIAALLQRRFRRLGDTARAAEARRRDSERFAHALLEH